MKKLSHDGNDDLLRLFAVLLESISEGLEERMEDPDVHGGHEKSSPEIGGSDFRDRSG